jgi:hypothetical protein
MKIRFFRIRHMTLLLSALCFIGVLLAACDSSFLTPSSSASNSSFTFPTNNGPITYSTRPEDVVVRTFYGGGNLGTLAFSPEVSIYGDGTYVLGPGYTLRWGKLGSDSVQQLLHTFVDSDGLLSLTRQEFYDVPDQNATFLQLTLNNKHYEFLYGKFGTLAESAQEIDEYHHLGKALAAIIAALQGPTHPYSSRSTALLVHQDYSPDLTQNIPSWFLPGFSLEQLATYECGVIPPDQTGPNADTGCLTFTTPHYAYLLTPQQLQSIKILLNGQLRGEFYEPASGLYYTVVLRPLLPDELLQKTLAMLGSQELSYTSVPLHSGTIPTPVATP